MLLRYVDQSEVAGKRIIARFDFNVPLSGGQIADTTRLDLSLPTLRHLIEGGVKKLVLMSHLGRPQGKAVKELSLEPIGRYLAEALGEEIVLTTSCMDMAIPSLIKLPKTKIVLLENLRFHPEEEANDMEFAKTLAQYGDLYVNDAFGACHRRHASTYGINAFYRRRCLGGLLLQRELAALAQFVDGSKGPLMAVMGGSKVSDKIRAIEALLPKVARLCIGGAMAYPLLAAQGVAVGTSLCSQEDLELSQQLLKRDRHHRLLLPIDHIASKELTGEPVAVSEQHIPSGLMGLDIGPQTLALYRSELAGAQGIFWNGPMGYFEQAPYSTGTYGMARILAEAPAFSVVGGGDCLRAVKQSGWAEKIDHLSTGGGAVLQLIEQGFLPGVEALKFDWK